MLRQITHLLHEPKDPNVLVGIGTVDDAGVYKISNDMALVQTVDFFTPIVDDPYMYGMISAANSLSDVYAMGGTPLTALNICAFPEDMEPEILEQILKGGKDKCNEAGTEIIGGHTVTDKELKYGLSVTGTVHPDKIYTNAGAKAGDALILTKPLGTGIITSAIKKGRASDQTIKEVCHWMSMLNKYAQQEMKTFQVHACTDVTGFGLAGHAFQMAYASTMTLKFTVSKLPHYPQALSFAQKGFLTQGDMTNREYTQDHTQIAEDIENPWAALIFDPQTSGGLLISLPKEQANTLLEKLQTSGYKHAAIVGEVVESQKPGIVFS